MHAVLPLPTPSPKVRCSADARSRSPRTARRACVAKRSPRSRRRIERQALRFTRDERVRYPAYTITGRKVDQRRFVAQMALSWLAMMRKMGARGAIMIDIDDTLIDGHECVQNGFQFMKELYQESALKYPIHVVTARPDSDHAKAMEMLAKLGFSIPPDRLHMLPAHLYEQRDTSHVEQFKWQTYLRIGHDHEGVVARFGDMLWDVAHIDALHTTLAHVRDRDAYVFLDPALNGTMSCKLPGAADD